MPGRFDKPDEFIELLHSMCPHCLQFFRSKGLTRHSIQCPQKSAVPSSPPSAASASVAGAAISLPSLEEVFSSFCPTLTFVPASHRLHKCNNYEHSTRTKARHSEKASYCWSDGRATWCTSRAPRTETERRARIERALKRARLIPSTE